MSRPKINRRMINPPKTKGFTPFGDQLEECEPVILFLEEYESIRLCDYELKTQAQAAGLMQVSRPTVTRIYESARRKMATALTEGRSIIIEGGKVIIDSHWYRCTRCESLFNQLPGVNLINACPLCGEQQIIHMADPADTKPEATAGIKNLLYSCACCGYEEFIPALSESEKNYCPQCGAYLKEVSISCTH